MPTCTVGARKILENCICIQYIDGMQNTTQITPSEWIDQCAARLHERWKTVDQAQLEDVALDIYLDDRLRHMPPADAAVAWLSPLSGPPRDSHA